MKKLAPQVSGQGSRGSYGRPGHNIGLIARLLGVMMQVLVAGDRGYIGTVLAPLLSAAGHDVDGLDLGLYEGCDLGPTPAYPAGGRGRLPQDMRDLTARHLAGYDSVVCLAALSNDP